MPSPPPLQTLERAKAARAAWLRALERTASIERHPHVTLPELLQRSAREHGAASALESREATLTYADLAARSRRYAHFGLSQGVAPGEVIALLLHNCADYLPIWLGLSSIGIVVALLNTHLVDQALSHSIRICRPRLIIVGAPLAGVLETARRHLPADLPCWAHTHTNLDFLALPAALAGCSDLPLDAARQPAPHIDAPALLIYTSGTTGLPKAARVSHRRVLQWSHWFAGLLDTGPADRMYNCLPLYHSIGGVVATGATLLGGGAVVLRARFSAADFWRDVGEQRCTLFQYIGELCRYLLNAPPDPIETGHALRVACGNGLRPEIWEAFRQRFRIPHILEYYASTEGSFSLYNCEEEPGAIGRIPSFLAQRRRVALVRIDPATGEPRRDAAGWCEACAVDEPGEALGMLAASAQENAGFEGYLDATATERKVLRGVFVVGDAWYRSGDLLRRDARGYYYFVDRLGDTFRWKGENVSTAEVMGTLLRMPGVRDGVVYGVRIAGADGRAGMAALLVDPAFDLRLLHAAVAAHLPSYARPLFVRLLPRLESTGTFRPVKHVLEQAQFDPSVVTDPLYFDDRVAGRYVPLDAALYQAIQDGALRL